jgi:hypothetical protein
LHSKYMPWHISCYVNFGLRKVHLGINVNNPDYVISIDLHIY